MELCDIAKYVSSLELKLKPKHKGLLLDFAVSPATSVYDHATPLPLPTAKDIWFDEDLPLPLSLLADGKPKDISHHKSSDSEYRDTKNQMPELIKLELVEQVQDQDRPNPHKAKRYKLTKNGVYFIITRYLTSAVASNMLTDYGDHPMYRFFLYPLISADTLSRLTALNSRSFLFSHVSSYLQHCCEEIVTANNNLELGKPLFIWEEILTGNNHAKALCNFLEHTFGWTWLDKAEIHKSDLCFSG